MQVICDNNRGYQWTDEGGTYFRGFILTGDGQVLRGDEAVQFFRALESFEEFTSILEKTEGCFAVIVCREEETWAAVDIERTMPLYYSADLEFLSDNAEIIRKKKKIKHDDINPLGCLEMYGAIYISYEDTIYDAIKQIDYRNAIRISKGRVETKVYYRDNTPIGNWERKEALARLRQVSERAVRRALAVVGDRTIILSLSGGYDSRFLACTLKNLGVEKVVCVAYGDRSSFEIRVSRSVAEALGYPWHCIEYTDKDILNIVSEENREFLQYTKEHDYTIYLQNFVAVKKLKEQHLIPEPEKSVFMVGLINDVTVGHYTPDEETAEKYGLNDYGLAEFIVDDSFARFELREDVRRHFHEKVQKSIEKYHTHVHDYQSFVTAWDDLNLGLGHSRNYPKMNKVHEFFGYEWLMPCMDRELMQFWRSIPVSMRQNHNLFAEYVTENLAKKYGVGQKKIEIPNAKTPLRRRIKRWLGGHAVKVFYPLGIPLKRKTDINNFAPMEVWLYREIRQKNAIKGSRAGIRHLMDVYFMEKRYGTDWYQKIKGMIR